MEGALSRFVNCKVRIWVLEACLTLANAPERLATSIDLIATRDTRSCVGNDSSAFSEEWLKKIGPKKCERAMQPPSAEPVPVLHPRYSSRGVTNHCRIYSQHFGCASHRI